MYEGSFSEHNAYDENSIFVFSFYTKTINCWEKAIKMNTNIINFKKL